MRLNNDKGKYIPIKSFASLGKNEQASCHENDRSGKNAGQQMRDQNPHCFITA